jgi:PAS domain S-box-containing protein
MAGEVRANHNVLSAPVDDQLFRQLAENIPALCWIADASGYISWYNPQWYAYTGTTPAEMEGWGWQSVHEPRNLAAVLERWSAAIASTQPFEMVFPIKGADGVFRPFLTRINPALDDQGNVTHWFGVNTDISLQVKAENTAAKTEARFRLIADSMPQMLWAADAGGRFDYFNARWYEFTGAPVGSTDGDGWSRMLHPEDHDRAWSAWRRALESGLPYRLEHRLRHHSGAYRWVLTSAQPERGNVDGSIDRWYGTFTDIEDIAQARRVLQRSRDSLEVEVIARTGERNLLATLVETTDVMVMAVDPAYTIIAINKANADEFERVYGMRAGVGDNLLALFADSPDELRPMKAAWNRVLAGQESTVVELRGNPARAQSSYEIKYRPLRDSTGAQIGAFQFASDVTERLRDQARLAQAQAALVQTQKLEAMGQLTGGVAHDFNNLLTPIIGSLDILHRRMIGGAREQRLIDAAFQSAQRAKILVQRLLAFARRQPLQSAAIDVGGLILGLSDLIKSTVGPQIELTIDVAEGPPFAKADPNQLEMAVLNLAVNSRDAMDGPGTIRIMISAEVLEDGEVSGLPSGRYVRLLVADTGRGMDEATLYRAIEPFFSTKGVGQGTGLGLSMAHGLATQLGGALTIASESGKGTQVSIWLPESDECPAAGAGNRDPQRSRMVGTALLVDDEANIRVSTADMLNALGFVVREASSAESALAEIDAGFVPELLITDHLMPGMTGVQLARLVRERRPTTKTLIVSGFADVEGIDPSFPRLTKPFLQSELEAALANLPQVNASGGMPDALNSVTRDG